jgi:hypothetical protein
MSIISITQRGSFDNTERYLQRLKTLKIAAILHKYGDQGVAALSNATPVDSGLTAGSWSYTIEEGNGYCSIRWHNSNEIAGAPLAVLLQYGHGTGTGGYVQGRDYINPAMAPIFDQIAADVEREVSRI